MNRALFESLEGRQLLSATMSMDMPLMTTSAHTAVVTKAAASPLALIKLGAKLTFKKTGGRTFSGTGYENGTFKDEKGKAGKYYLPIVANLGDALLGLQTKTGAPLALITIHFNAGNHGVGGKTLTFGVAKAGSKGTFQVAGASGFFK